MARRGRRWAKRYRSEAPGPSKYPIEFEHDPPAAARDGIVSIEGALDLPPEALAHHYATHEAGHVVAAQVAGIPITSARLGAGRLDASGMEVMGTVNYGAYDTTWVGFGATFAAGEVASHRWLDEHGKATPNRRWAVEMGATSDRTTAETIARDQLGMRLTFGLPDPDNPELSDWTELVDEAADILAPRWSAVRRVADALVERGTLTGRDIDELL